MRVSQKLEYACRAAVCLAKQYDGNTVVKLEEIAQREDISPSFLVQILNELKRAEIVTSKRGKTGGYVLAKPPTKVTLRDVVHAVEPSLLASPIVTTGDSAPAVTNVWQELSTGISGHLNSVTLEQMASQTAAPMYHI